MMVHVTLFGAGHSGTVEELEAGDGSRLLAYLPDMPPGERGQKHDERDLTALLQQRGGILVRERSKGTAADVSCSMFPAPAGGASPPGNALWLRIRGADRLEPLAQAMTLSMGDHVIVPVDSDAEVALAQFHAMVQRFPEDARRLILGSLRRPTLDWEVDQLKAALGGKDGAGEGAPAAGTSGGSPRSSWVVAAAAALVVIVLEGLGVGGYLGLRAAGVLGSTDRPVTTAAPAPTAVPVVTATATASARPADKPPEQRIDERMQELKKMLDESKDKDLASLGAQLKDADWKKNRDAAWVLAVLFHRSLGAGPDAAAYKTPAQSQPLSALLKQPAPRRDALLKHALCQTKPQPQPAALPKPEGCGNDLKDAADALEWIIESIDLQSRAGTPEK